MFSGLPTWAKIFMIVMASLIALQLVYVFSECGWKAFFLGNGATYAAYTGMCK